jgi:hypothetical protein
VKKIRRREEPEDYSKQESECWDQVAHSRCKGRRAVAYASEDTILHQCYPAKPKEMEYWKKEEAIRSSRID